jgi:C-terminal processing protease CtpA/Prc
MNSRNVFSTWYKLVFQPDSILQLSFTDTTGHLQQKNMIIGSIKRDSIRERNPVPNAPRRVLPLLAYNEKALAIDTTYATAYMVVNTFATGNHLKSFFRKSFRTLKKQHIKNLIIDVRYNGGGNVSNSNLLTRMLVNKPYKIADSLYAVSKTYYEGKHIQYHFWQWPLMTVISKKQSDGYYHFGYYEKHFFKPKKKNHYNGKVYIITGYHSFSATSIFANTLKGQENVLLVGEETGGGRYGNNAWLVPDVTLPQTGVRFTLPKFKLVMNKNLPKNGRGVPVDVEAAPTQISIQKGIDVKMRKVGELMRTQH